jgi:hypothetical protein
MGKGEENAGEEGSVEGTDRLHKYKESEIIRSLFYRFMSFSGKNRLQSKGD